MRLPDSELNLNWAPPEDFYSSATDFESFVKFGVEPPIAQLFESLAGDAQKKAEPADKPDQALATRVWTDVLPELVRIARRGVVREYMAPGEGMQTTIDLSSGVVTANQPMMERYHPLDGLARPAAADEPQ